jgi:hypothetical protein
MKFQDLVFYVGSEDFCDVFFLGISTSDFNLSHFDTCYYFDVSSHGVSSLVKKTSVASSSLVSQPVTSTLVTLIPVDTLVLQVKVYLLTYIHTITQCSTVGLGWW